MKLVNWAIENSLKNIVIVTKTNDQAFLICEEIKRTLRYMNETFPGVHSYSPATREEVRFGNETKILIAAEHTTVSRFRGMTIDVLLFCDNMVANTINVINRHLLPAVSRGVGIIGELKI